MQEYQTDRASSSIDRRRFLQQTTAGITAMSTGFLLGSDNRGAVPAIGQPGAAPPELPAARLPYKGPNVVLVRFGGGVRRQETIDWPEKTYCPFVYHELVQKQG